MTDDIAALLASPDWFKALTLAERAALRAGQPSPAKGRLPAARRRLSARRLARWQNQESFARNGTFARRLARDGASVASLRTFLGQTPAELAAGITTRPLWLEELAAAFMPTQAPAPAPSIPPHPDLQTVAPPDPAAAGTARFPLTPEMLAAGGQAPFLEIARPVLDRAFGRLHAGLAALAAASPMPRFDPSSTAEMLGRCLTSHIQLLLGRTLVLELHLAGLAGTLPGETPEERFHAFIARLREPVFALDILHRYPVLARQLVETARRQLDFGLEICANLAAADDRWRTAFAPAGDPGKLVEIATGLGDAHRGGRSVARLRFESGLQLIYKPRPMAIEATFQTLLQWACERGFSPMLRQLRVVDCGDHGWAELVEPAPCAGPDAVERFYLRQGGYLALLYVLSGTDMHHENLIAAGEHPMLLDLEALFHPLDQTLGGATPEATLPDTVMRVGFLPDGGWGARAGGGAGIDLSGLTATAGQVVPQAILGLADSGTDRMRFQKRQMEMPVGAEHLPRMGGAAVPLAPYTAALTNGFRRMACLLAAHRAELQSVTGPLAAFANIPVRVLLRQTMAYATLYNDAQHPYVLGDALERERLLDLLWAVVPERPAFERLVAAEHRDLCRGDIPLFTTRPGSRDLLTSDGECIAGFLDQTGLERVHARLRDLDEPEIERQAWLVQSALDAATGNLAPSPDYELHPGPASPAAAELLAAATAVGQRLEALAFRSGGAAIWFGPDLPEGESRWRLVPAGADLHLGVPGIALFLAYLGEVSGDERFTRLAREAIVTLRAQLAPDAELLSAIGAFSGWGGAIYALAHLGTLWQDESLTAEAERIAASLGPAIDTDEHCDVVGGAAGCLVCLLGLHRLRPSQRLLDLAVRCGERLLGKALPMAQGLGWAPVLSPGPPLAGFSHGAAGISWALLQLAAASGDARFHRAALAAVDYERSLYSHSARNWPDLRAGGQAADGGPRHLTAWCHGAPGIALARLDGLRFAAGAAVAHTAAGVPASPDPRPVPGTGSAPSPGLGFDNRLCEDARIAVETTLATGFGHGHCLCHGDLGNLEVITEAAEALADPALAAHVGRLAGGILAGIRERGWLLGLPVGEPPGLMVGLAGVGHGLLRLAAPRRVPNVLRLAPPAPPPNT